MSFEKVKAYLDLTRLHFFFVWPLLFCSGLFLSFPRYGGFSWPLVGKAVLIAILGFEAGFVLNDYVDREIDRRDVDPALTKYWRPFDTRPIPSGAINPGSALTLFGVLAASSAALILSLPYPNSVYVLGIMAYSYVAEYFYQVKKRNQEAPLAQLIGRTDFALFPVAGYLLNGRPDSVALLYLLFFYPFAQAHLGANDIIDAENDEARGLKTIPLLYGTKGTKDWIHVFSLLHLMGALMFIGVQGTIARYGITAGLLVLTGANMLIRRGKTPSEWMKALPLFHMTMLVYITSMIADYFI
jgi:4-hydroxybenzoate polyprenyltransferase